VLFVPIILKLDILYQTDDLTPSLPLVSLS